MTCFFAILIALKPILSSNKSLKGFHFMKDCSGRDAGNAWAASSGVTDPSQCQCTEHFRSFVEGCLAYALGR